MAHAKDGTLFLEQMPTWDLNLKDMKTYKVGIIGYGGFGQFLHHWWDRLEQIEIVAIADTTAGLKTEGNCKLYGSWKELLADPQIDIVSIVTPPTLHAEMACAAMQAGKHVLLEKPVAINLVQAERILKVQAETEKIITVDHMIRYNPIIHSLMALSEIGALGKLRHAAVHNYAQDQALPAEHWFWDEKVSGGIMVEHGVHFFDIVSALSRQKPVEVYGTSDQRNQRQRDRMSAIVKYDDGLLGEYHHAFSGPGFFEQTTLHLAYDLARIEIEGWMPMKGTLKALTNFSTRKAFTSLPDWKEISAEAIGCGSDDSRPEGWGAAEALSEEKDSVKAGGIFYKVDHIVSGSFEIQRTKAEVYGRCVQELLLDVITKIENKEHELAVTLQDGVQALRTALLASR